MTSKCDKNKMKIGKWETEKKNEKKIKRIPKIGIRK